MRNTQRESKKLPLLALLAFGCAVALIPGCQGREETGKLRVVCTTTMIADRSSAS